MPRKANKRIRKAGAHPRACSHCGAAPEAYTFDDISLMPRELSRAQSRRDENISLKSQISPNITLNIPVIASYMDTVCEADMAIAMARMGGMGVIHRWMSVEDQVAQVRRVKREENKIIKDPYTLPIAATVQDVRNTMKRYGVGGILIVSDKREVLGIVTTRDIDFHTQPEAHVASVMTPRERLVTAHPRVSTEVAMKLFREHSLEKIPLVDKRGVLQGLISKKDIKKLQNPLASRDAGGHLRVGASIGLRGHDLEERTAALLDAGADLIVLSIANGYLEGALDAVKTLRKKFPQIELAAGVTAEYEGTKRLFDAGADTVLVGIGPGSICETRYITGVGIPQFSALRWAARAAREEGKFIISDGGVHHPHQFVKALFAGASAVILGGALAGTDEAPGDIVTVNGQRMKHNRGLASDDAKQKLDRVHGREVKTTEADLWDDVYMHVAAEGVESGFVQHSGSAREAVKRITGGARSAFTYLGAHNVEEMWEACDRGQYVKQTEAGYREGAPHDLNVFRS